MIIWKLEKRMKGQLDVLNAYLGECNVGYIYHDIIGGGINLSCFLKGCRIKPGSKSADTIEDAKKLFESNINNWLSKANLKEK